jgi:hypothetical protein
VSADFSDFINMHAKIHGTSAHAFFQNNPVKHLWMLKGESEPILF